MRLVYLFIFILLYQVGFAQKKKVLIDKKEAKQAYSYINSFRKKTAPF